MPRISKVYQMSEEDFISMVAKADSYADCLRQLSLTTNGGSSLDILKRRIRELGCSTEHFGEQAKKVSPNVQYALDEILIENSSYQNITRLKERLIKEGRLEYKCSICGISDWMGKKLVLQLDHINGNNSDHRLSNLRFLCPNCHSQTDTYAGKNKNK